MPPPDETLPVYELLGFGISTVTFADTLLAFPYDQNPISLENSAPLITMTLSSEIIKPKHLSHLKLIPSKNPLNPPISY